MARLIHSIVGVLALIGCGPDYDPAEYRFTGEAARERIEQLTGDTKTLPESTRNFYIFDGGSFGGSIVYVSFDCGSREDCWTSVACLGGSDAAEFKPWAESSFAVVMEGPGFYHESLRLDPWNVREIRNSLVHEQVVGDHRSMHYYAIDFERNRIYYHRETGGFRSTRYTPSVAKR
jgi:hypothetical protein